MGDLTLSPALIAELSALCPGGALRDVPLSQLSRWKIGGPAALILRPDGTGQLAALRRCLARHAMPHLVIGETSNLLFSDEGLQVPCIQIGARMARLSVSGTRIEAEAGVWVPYLARIAMQAGLTGAEHICGIPGTLGGLVCMNGGSQRKGIGTAVLEVTAIDCAGGETRRTATDCGFAYRASVYQQNDEIITSTRLEFSYAAERDAVRRSMLAILKDRRGKFPRRQPNCGSVFKSNPVMYDQIGPPGAAIERLGFKGRRVGGARVSPQHANFIVNEGGASARDVQALIHEIAQAVDHATGHRMEVEVRLVTPQGRVVPLDAPLTEDALQ